MTVIPDFLNGETSMSAQPAGDPVPSAMYASTLNGGINAPAMTTTTTTAGISWEPNQTTTFTPSVTWSPYYNWYYPQYASSERVAELEAEVRVLKDMVAALLSGRETPAPRKRKARR